MTNTASAQETKHNSAFAQLWLMLRAIFALMLRPGGWVEADARMTELEHEIARALLARILADDPAAAHLTVGDFEIVRLYNTRGAFDPDFRLKPHLIAAHRADRIAFLKQLRRLRLARVLMARAATFRGLLGRLRRRAGVSAIHRRRTSLRTCARIAERAAPRDLIPP